MAGPACGLQQTLGSTYNSLQIARIVGGRQGLRARLAGMATYRWVGNHSASADSAQHQTRCKPSAAQCQVRQGRETHLAKLHGEDMDSPHQPRSR